jgi:hypothetical protein
VELLGHSSSCNFLSHLYIVFHNGHTILRSHQQCTRVPVSPHLTLVIFIVLVPVLMDLNWQLIIVLGLFLTSELIQRMIHNAENCRTGWVFWISQSEKHILSHTFFCAVTDASIYSWNTW